MTEAGLSMDLKNFFYPGEILSPDFESSGSDSDFIRLSKPVSKKSSKTFKKYQQQNYNSIITKM